MERIKKFLLTSEVSIHGVGEYIPKEKLTSDEIEKRLLHESEYKGFQKGIIYEISGTYTRYFASLEENASTLAIEASKKAIQDAHIKIESIDCIIFASASHDITEPATGNIVQAGLGIHVPVFDIKNACNSFLNGLQMARSLIKSGQYKTILVCSGETPSRAIRWNTKDRDDFRQSLAGYNLGDAGVAMILGKKKKDKPIITFTEFYSTGEFYDASMIPGGGSCFPRDPEKMYFLSDSKRLSQAFGEEAKSFLQKTLQKNSWSMSSIQYYLPHIVSRYSSEVFREVFHISHHKIFNHNATHGNIASCAVPYALISAMNDGKFCSGDRGLLVGLAAGASFGLVGIQF